MKKITLALALLLTLGACSDPDTAEKALSDQGYSKIIIKGYAFMGCGKDDDFTTSFEATSMGGKVVKGVVCSGWFKGATIRTF